MVFLDSPLDLSGKKGAGFQEFGDPREREQMVRYYGFYSNVSRGLRQKEKQDAFIALQSLEILYAPPHL